MLVVLSGRRLLCPDGAGLRWPARGGRRQQVLPGAHLAPPLGISGPRSASARWPRIPPSA